jgi:pimeloyl-ACP methyl ester carboxylesterase
MWTLLGRKVSGKIINFFGKTYQYSTLLTGMEEEVDTKALTGYAYSNQNAPYQGRLGEITIPILIIRGLDDQFDRSYSQYIKESVKGPCYWLEVPLAEHLVALEKPVEFNLASTAFLIKVQKVDSATIIKAAEQSKGLFKW